MVRNGPTIHVNAMVRQFRTAVLLSLAILCSAGFCQARRFVFGGPALMQHLGMAPDASSPDTASVCSLLSAWGYSHLGATHIDLASLFLSYKLGTTILLVRTIDERTDIRVVINAAIEIRKVASSCDTLIRLWTNGDLSVQAPFAEDINSLSGIETVYLLSREPIDTAQHAAAIAAELRSRQYPLRIGLRQLTVRGDFSSLSIQLADPLARRPAKPEEQVLVFTVRHFPDSAVDSIRMANNVARVWRGTPSALKLQGLKIVPDAPARSLLGLLDSIPDGACSDTLAADTGARCEIHHSDRCIECANYLAQPPDAPLRTFIARLYEAVGVSP